MQKIRRLTKEERELADKAKKENFAKILRSVEQSATVWQSCEFQTAIKECSRLVAFSVLKTCIKVSANEYMFQLRRELAGNIGDGADLAQVAATKLLQEVKKQVENNGYSYVDLEEKYVVWRRQKSIQVVDSDYVPQYHQIETSPIKEVYHAVRSYIYNIGSVKVDPRNGYVYIADLLTNSADKNCDEDCQNVIYYRLNKYYDLGGSVHDYNGKEVAYTGDIDSVNDQKALSNLIDSCNFSDRQQQVLDYRLKGYGNGKISECLHVSEQAVAKNVHKMQDKYRRFMSDRGFAEKEINDKIAFIDLKEEETKLPAAPEIKSAAEEREEIHKKIAIMQNNNAIAIINRNRYDIKQEEKIKSMEVAAAAAKTNINDYYNNISNHWEQIKG